MSKALVARNSVLMLSAQVIARVAGLCTFVLLTRFLTVAEVGVFGYAASLVGFLVLGVDFGFDLVMMRETAQGKGGESAGLALRLKTAMFAALYPVLLVATYGLGGRGPVLALVAILGAAVWHESANRTLGAFYLARGRAEYGLVSEFLTSLLRLSIVLVVLLAGLRLVGVGVAYFAASGVAAVALASYVVRHGFRPAFDAPAGEARRVFAEAWAFAVYALLFQLYFRIDVVLLGFLRPPADVGQYVAAFRVIEAMLVVPAALNGALYPVLSRLAGERDRGSFARACAESTRLLLVVGLALVLAASLGASPVIRVIAGRGYGPAIRYLPVLVAAFGLICLYSVGLLALNALGRQRSNVWIMLAGAITKTAWNMIFIPRYGPMAACVGSVVTTVLVAACVAAAVRQWFGILQWLSAWRGAALALAAGLAAALLVAGPSVWTRLLAAELVFVAVALLTRALRPADLATLRETWRSRSTRPVEAA